MNQFEKMKQETMRRIYVIYFMRKALGRTALKVYALAALVWFQSLKISIPHIIANMPKNDPVRVYHFYSAAFLNTQLAVQVGIVAIAAILAFLSLDFLPRREQRFQ